MAKRDPINPTDEDARKLAQKLLHQTRFGALAISHPATSAPYAARVAMLWAGDALLTLVSTLSLHTKALQTNPACAALIGEPEGKGDPLTHPRMTVVCQAELADKAVLKAHWLAAIPKAKLYYDFTDFQMYRLKPTEAHLNGGFGKTYHLSPDDLRGGRLALTFPRHQQLFSLTHQHINAETNNADQDDTHQNDIGALEL